MGVSVVRLFSWLTDQARFPWYAWELADNLIGCYLKQLLDSLLAHGSPGDARLPPQSKPRTTFLVSLKKKEIIIFELVLS